MVQRERERVGPNISVLPVITTTLKVSDGHGKRRGRDFMADVHTSFTLPIAEV